MQREPLFNVPRIVVAVLALLALIHGARELLLSDEQNIAFLYAFGFVPARFDAGLFPAGGLPGGTGAEVWSFVTYSLLHADWMHLGVNAIWLLPFGSALARRFGALRFLAFFAVTAAAGAALHLATHVGERIPMIGASAAISGTMAAAMRFAFERGGPLGFWRNTDEEAYRVPALPLTGLMRNSQILGFVAVWFSINLLFGLGSLSMAAANQSVAWQAHIGGFFAGLLLFSWFDPVPGHPDDDPAATRH